MSTTTELRSEVEIAQQRATAELRVRGSSAYLAARAAAVIEVFDWVAGQPGAAAPAALRDPAKSYPAPDPDPHGLAIERALAESDEELARAVGSESRRPGVHGHALAWLLRDPDTDAPIW